MVNTEHIVKGILSITAIKVALDYYVTNAINTLKASEELAMYRNNMKDIEV